MARQHNFSAGPAALPLSVVESLAPSLIEFGSTGAGIMEISHRSADFEQVIESAEARLRRLLHVPQDYSVLFLQGGASLQFYMAPINLLHQGEFGDYCSTGVWSKKALKEAQRISENSKAIWDGKEDNYASLPDSCDDVVREEATYFHYTTNNTIFGTQFKDIPLQESRRVVADMSSDICSRTIDVASHDLIYAGAQKNLGPSGVCVVICSPWVKEKSLQVGAARLGGLPAMLDYALQIQDGSMYNTPNTFGIFVLEKVLGWIESQGNVEGMEKRNRKKASLLYSALDASDFWEPHAAKAARSDMNVTWRIRGNSALEKIFVQEAEAAGLRGLKGHRLVGGLRASIYNACPIESIQALVDFMSHFEKTRG